MQRNQTSPSKHLLRAVRAAFIANGTSLSAWCQANGITREWATQCLQGNANGEAAANLVHRLVDASSVQQTQIEKTQ